MTISGLLLNSTDSTSNFGSPSLQMSATPPLVVTHCLQAHASILGGGLGVLIVDKFCLSKRHQSYPHLRQSSGHLFQSSPPPINNIPCGHPKSSVTLWLRGHRVIVCDQHHVCATPMAKIESSGSCMVTNRTSGPSQPHRSASEWGGGMRAW